MDRTLDGRGQKERKPTRWRVRIVSGRVPRDGSPPRIDVETYFHLRTDEADALADAVRELAALARAGKGGVRHG